MACNYLLCSIILASFVQTVILTKNDGCPAIQVKKDQIIRTKEALDNGAKYLAKKSVESAHDCYTLCCENDNCNLGMMSYKNDSSDHLVRTCYLFDCGSPSRCTFSHYKHYATITFEGKRKESLRRKTNENINSYKSNRQPWRHLSGCPNGAPVAACYSNPCDRAKCPNNPWAFCKASTCGSCHAEFFDENNQLVKCYGNTARPKWSAQDILKEMDRFHQNNNKHSVRHSNDNKLETRLNHLTKKKPIVHKTVQNNQRKVTDPPFHQWREFIDNNPKYARPKKTTEKPTRKPTTFHQWREFIDNNPKYTRPPPKQKPTHKTTMKSTRKTTLKPTKKIIKTLKAAKTTPLSEEKPITNSPPKLEDNDRRASNISDVVVIETSNLRIVENKAVVPLAIFLVVALILLFVVALRLKVMKNRLRRKAFATDDADYLINGMYL